MPKLKIQISDRVKDKDAFMAFLSRLPETFMREGLEIHAARNRLRIMDTPSLGVNGSDRVMVKRYHGLFWFQKVYYTFFRAPKCRRAFDNTAELRRRGFDAAEELAIVEVWNYGLFQYAFFVSEVAEGEKLDNLVIQLQEQNHQDVIREIISQYAALVVRLHEHGVLYWDMNCGNVLCKQKKGSSDNQWHFSLIDTNRVRFYPENQQLDLDTAIGDLILMNPKMGTVELFQEEYLRQRGLYTPEEARRIRELQRQRYERKKYPLKKIFNPIRKHYYKWLEP
ncbi:MAG: hypothetical protein IJ786_02665 [Bacteroidaceae bacterium]|nr:hypothetical protein [Bacteroidaceae bacterium]